MNIKNNTAQIQEKFKQTMLCPYCKQSYVKVTIIHTYSNDYNHCSYDCICPICNFKTTFYDR